jgi:hypothetical protein
VLSVTANEVSCAPLLNMPFSQAQASGAFAPVYPDPPADRRMFLVGSGRQLLWSTGVANALLRWMLTRGSTNETCEIEATLLSLRWRGVKVPDSPEVREYLLRYPDVTDAITIVCDLASERLGVGAQLSLEVYHDPEIEDQYLTVYVPQESYDERIMGLIEGLCQVCEQKLAGSSGWLLVTTDFAPPM